MHVMDHYRAGEVEWQPSLQIRALLEQDRLVSSWKALLDKFLYGLDGDLIRALRWDFDACKAFDDFLSHECTDAELSSQLPRLLAAGLRHAEHEPLPFPRKPPSS